MGNNNHFNYLKYFLLEGKQIAVIIEKKFQYIEQRLVVVGPFLSKANTDTSFP